MVSVRGLLNIQSLNESTHEKVSPPVSTRHGTRPILFARPTGLPPEPVPQLRRTQPQRTLGAYRTAYVNAVSLAR